MNSRYLVTRWLVQYSRTWPQGSQVPTDRYACEARGDARWFAPFAHRAQALVSILEMQ
eukprot:COSAG02_NODE_619_length_19446_cov_9.557141_2_plen_58_part_00